MLVIRVINPVDIIRKLFREQPRICKFFVKRNRHNYAIKIFQCLVNYVKEVTVLFKAREAVRNESIKNQNKT